MSAIEWETIPLGRLVTFYAGGSLPEGQPYEGQDDGYFLMKVSDMNLPGNGTAILRCNSWSKFPGARSATCPAGAVVIPKRGGAIGTNKKRIITRPSVLDPNLMAIRPQSDKVDLGFLYHWLTTFDLASIASGSSVPQLNKRDLAPIPLPLPPVEEQRRIAEILGRADELRVKRRQALAHLDSLAQSVFLDMFGDPRLNPQGLPVVAFGTMVDEFRYGTSSKSSNTGSPALRIPNVINGTLSLKDIKTVPTTPAEFDRLRLVDGDILFVRTNGNPDYVGRCAVFDERLTQGTGFQPNSFIYASYLIRARVNKLRIHPTYAQAFMAGAAGRAALRDRCKTSAGQFNLNVENLGSVPVPVPPLAKQLNFVHRTASIDVARAVQRASLAELDALFAALQDRAFRGSL
ncbi:restriction endonuclease subunit S [Micromonospora sp. SD12]|uniref:restriction endonuclease subunit S n=1 Tax=Micromonospora sp. SD12 TaxID=3452216 RepID=UPI003F8B3BC6